MPNPFGTTFESLESPTGPVVDAVHEAPYRRLLELIDSGDGQLVSLRAPRAGYGKTMLLSRLRDKKKASMAIIPIHLADGRRVEGESILEEVLTQLAESVPGAGGLTKLDLHTRRLFAHGLLPLVYSGEVPSQDKAGALDSLRDRPTEAFDFHNEGASIAQWTKSQFEVLSPRLASVLGKSCGASTRDTSYWIHLLSQFAVRTPSEASRTGDLMDAVFGFESRFRTGAGFLDGLGSLLNLITLVEPAVLVLDEVDGLSSDSDSALRATSTLISLWESAPRTSVIISVNDDVWESAFAPRLPLGLRDRLEDVVIRLNPLTKEEAQALVRIRSGSRFDEVLKELELGSGNLYPRGVLKAAREAWGKCDVKAKAAKEENQPKDCVAAPSEFSISGASASDQSDKSSEPEKLAKSEPVTGVASQPKSSSSSKILAGAAAVSSFVKGKGRKTTPEAADLEEAKTSVAQVDVATPDRLSSFGDSTDKKLTDSKPVQESSPFDSAPPEASSSVKEVVTKDPISSPQEGVAAKEAATIQPVTSEKEMSQFEAALSRFATPQPGVAVKEVSAIQPVTPEKVASPFEAASSQTAAPVKEVSVKDSILSAKEAAAIQSVTPEKAASPFEAASSQTAAPVKEVSVKDSILSAKEAAAIQSVTPEKVASPFEAASSQTAAPVKEVSVKDSILSAKEAAAIQPVTPEKVASPFAAASSQTAAPVKEVIVKDTRSSSPEAVVAKEAGVIEPVTPEKVASPFEAAATIQPVTPEKVTSPFEAASSQATSAVEEVIVKETRASTPDVVAVQEAGIIEPVTPEKVTSPFESASSQAVSPFESAPVKEAAASIQTPAAAQKASPTQPVVAPVESSPFQVAPAQQPAAAPVQAPSPFEAAPAQAASPFQAQPAAVAAAPVSPFQVSNQARPQGQSTLPPARPIAQHTPAQPSPFEAAQAPVTAMDMAPAAASPYGGQPVAEERRSQRVFPSNAPFDSAVAKAASAPAQGFPAQPAPVQAESIQAPPIFAAAPTPAVTSVQPSPFGQNLEPKALPAQPNVPKGDTDAIDELLRQFREHRDS